MIDNGDLLNVNEDTAESIIEAHKSMPESDNMDLVDKRIKEILLTMKVEGALDGK